ncbi:MAG TPA: GNAT family N-acetyltransferase [Burkholderiaceae bacterium]|nr:GNAT family N-acetyltransferase [Burkholderiaceae bacterium]
MPLTLHPLTPARWPDLEAIFQAKGCSIARGCWCLYYRESGKVEVPEGQTLAQARRARLRALTEAKGTPPGLIGYRGKTPVGWISLGPREDFAKLKRSPVMKPVDDAPVWSIVCFVVPAEYRGQGVARELLRGAIAWAAQRGVTLLEAYPIDKPQRSHDEFIWHGAKSMFDAAGFEEVARRKPQRPVVRLRPV